MFLQQPHDDIIVLRSVGKAAVYAAFDYMASSLHHPVFSGTLHIVQRTIAKQAVDIPIHVVTRIVLTISVCKKSTGVLHILPLSFSSQTL